jgi:hypothetical protein
MFQKERSAFIFKVEWFYYFWHGDSMFLWNVHEPYRPTQLTTQLSLTFVPDSPATTNGLWILPYCITTKYILILSFYVRLGLAPCLSLQVYQPKTANIYYRFCLLKETELFRKPVNSKPCSLFIGHMVRVCDGLQSFREWRDVKFAQAENHLPNPYCETFLLIFKSQLAISTSASKPAFLNNQSTRTFNPKGQQSLS